MCARACAVGVLLAASGGADAAAGPVLSGLMGEQAVLVVQGVPRVVRAGTLIDGVRVLAVTRDGVDIDDNGRRFRLTLQGHVAVQDRPSASAPGGGDAAEGVAVRQGADGLYAIEGSVQGTVVRGVIDTGANLMAIPQRVAESLNLHAGPTARSVTVQTASGRTSGQRVTIPELRFAGSTLRDVDAVVIAGLPTVLWGHSVLRAFQIVTAQGRMTLKPMTGAQLAKAP